MAFVYHRVPEEMSGSVLYPLSVLKEQHLELYLTRQKHHQFQPHVLDGSIPKLGCFWDDVLHFTALHPKQIADALRAHGFSIPLKYYEINAAVLEPEKTIVYMNPPREKGEPTKTTDFVPFNPDTVDTLAFIPHADAGKDAKTVPTADEFLLNYRAPYILYRGTLNIRNAPIVEV